MTAKTIMLPDREFSKEEIEAIVSVAQDPFCPDEMGPNLVESAARCAGLDTPKSLNFWWNPEAWINPTQRIAFAKKMLEAVLPAIPPASDLHEAIASVTRRAFVKSRDLVEYNNALRAALVYSRDRSDAGDHLMTALREVARGS